MGAKFLAPAPLGGVETIFYEGRLAAVVTQTEARLAPDVEFGDPAVALFVFAMAAYALDPTRLADGDPFKQVDAEFIARWLLMPNAAFAPLAHLPDAHLAELFGVPLAEVARKRDDLTRLAGL